jgi:cell division protein FtsQ
VHRVSADTIEVRFETHEPLARWNDDGLVSQLGEVFSAEYDEPLPIFRGSDGAAPALTREYPLIVAAVAPLGSPLTELRLNPRGAWQATLASGLVLDLGRNDMEGRIARFASAWPELEARGVATTHADLRYPNGFALRVTEKPKDRDKEKKRAT